MLVSNKPLVASSVGMASKSVNRLDDKHSFVELTPKQKVVVRALADHPDKGPKEIAELASESLEDDTVSRSYVHPIKQKYSHLVEQQREIWDNQRSEGTARTTGDPFETLDETLISDSEGYQTIQERPYEESEPRSGSEPTDRMCIDVSRADVEALLAGDVPEELRRELIIQVVDRAFKSDG